MLIKQVIEAFELLDSSTVSGADAVSYLESIHPEADAWTYPLAGTGEKAGKSTDMVKVRIPGSRGKSRGGDAPTIGLLGRLGGIGARPER